MPFLRIISNAALKNDNPEQCAEKAAELISLTLKKPLDHVGVCVCPEETMCFKGSAKTKGVLAYLESIGFNDKAEVVKLLTEFLAERFEGVEPATINIVLTDLDKSNVAGSGKLFD